MALSPQSAWITKNQAINKEPVYVISFDGISTYYSTHALTHPDSNITIKKFAQIPSGYTQTIETQEGRSSIGNVEVGIVDVYDGTNYEITRMISQYAMRNKKCTIRQGFDGLTWGAFLPIYTGYVGNCKFAAEGGAWKFEVRDLLGQLKKNIFQGMREGELHWDITATGTTMYLRNAFNLKPGRNRLAINSSDTVRLLIDNELITFVSPSVNKNRHGGTGTASVTEPGTDVAYALSTDHNEYWSSGSNYIGQWFKLDLTSSLDITGIGLCSKGHHAGSYLLEGSNDDTSYSEILSFDGMTDWMSDPIFILPRSGIFFRFPKVTYRYLRLTATSKSIQNDWRLYFLQAADDFTQKAYIWNLRRGQDGTTAVAHTANSIVKEIYMIEGNPYDIACRVLLTKNKNQVGTTFDCYYPDQGLGLSISDVDLSAIQTERNNWLSGWNMRFYISDEIDAKEFLEEEIFKVTNSYPIITSEGKLKFKKFRPILVGELVDTYDENKILDIPEFDMALDELVNNARFHYDYDFRTSTYNTVINRGNYTSIKDYGKSTLLEIKSKGLRGANNTLSGGDMNAGTHFNGLWNRITQRNPTKGPSKIQFDTFYELGILEVGDIIKINNIYLPDPDQGVRGLTGSGSRSYFEIIEKNPNWDEGFYSFKGYSSLQSMLKTCKISSFNFIYTNFLNIPYFKNNYGWISNASNLMSNNDDGYYIL